MGARKGTGGAGVRDGRTAATRVGRWYAEGPEGRRFVAGDPAFSIFRVVSDDSAVPVFRFRSGCSTPSPPRQG